MESLDQTASQEEENQLNVSEVNYLSQLSLNLIWEILGYGPKELFSL